MKKAQGIVGACLVLGLAAACMVWGQTTEPDIAGYYSENNGEYTKFTKNGDDVYQYVEHLKTGEWIGIAIREGDALSIGWSKSDGQNLGVSVFKIQQGPKGPTLEGRWSNYPGGGTRKSTLTWSRSLEGPTGKLASK